MLSSPRKNGLTSLFKEVRVFKAMPLFSMGCFSSERVSRTSAGIFFVQSRGEFPVINCLVKFCLSSFLRKCRSKGPEICRFFNFSRQISRVQNQNFMRIFALRELCPDCFPMIFKRQNGPSGRNRGNGPLRSENGPLRRGNGPLRPWCWLAFQSAPSWAVFGHPHHGGKNSPSKRPIERFMSLEGVRMSNFHGPLKLSFSTERFCTQSHLGRQKSKPLRGYFRGEVPPSSVQYVSRSPTPISNCSKFIRMSEKGG